MTSLMPTNVNYGEVVGHFILAVGDGADADTNPDALAAAGEVIFTPAVETILNVGATPPVTIWPLPVICTISATTGELIGPNGQPGVQLIATDDPDGNPVNWTYRVQITIAGIPKPRRFDIAVPMNQTTDLAKVTPVTASGGTYF